MLYAAAIFLAAVAWAKLEIEIEGPDGWAANLPTWRVKDHFLLRLFYGGRPLTGYHVWAFFFVFLCFHVPLAALRTWSVHYEVRVIGAYHIFWIVEDFLWFVLNPHYGLSNFKPSNIWWHKKWLLGLPLDYWVWGLFGLTCILI